jgi:hypothetical protein
MSNKRYQIVKINAETAYGKTADKSISAGLTWEEALRSLENSDLNIDMALASLEFHKLVTFRDESGQLCELRVHSV